MALVSESSAAREEVPVADLLGLEFEPIPVPVLPPEQPSRQPSIWTVGALVWVAQLLWMARSAILQMLRAAAGCDPPEEIPQGWSSWAALKVEKAVRLIAYEETVHDIWWLQCRRTEYMISWQKLGIIGATVLISALLYWYRTRSRLVRKVDGLATSPEGIIPGSPLMSDGPVPSCQVAVAIKKDGALIVVGGGLRVDDYLLTPTHNTTHGMELWIIKGDKERKVDTSTEILLAADLSAFKVPVVDWVTLGVKLAKLRPLRGPTSVTVTSSCDNKFSVSTLTYAGIMGRAIYKGSTQPGFSGSAYADGESVVGIHCHGGLNGGGYEILYAYRRLQLAINMPPEDSDEFFMREARYGFDYEELGDHAVIVRTNGGCYHRTSDQMLERMQHLSRLPNLDWADETELEQLQAEIDRKLHPESRLGNLPEPRLQAGFSGEGQRPEQPPVAPAAPAIPLPPPASSITVDLPESLLARMDNLTQTMDRCCSIQQRVQRSMKEFRKLRKSTVPRTPPLALNGSAS